MKKKLRIIVFFIFIIILMASCKSGAKPQADSIKDASVAHNEDAAEQPSQAADGDASEILAQVSEPVPPPEETPAAEELAEPLNLWIDLDPVETVHVTPPPAEPPVTIALREPESPLTEPAPVVEPPPVSPPKPPASVATQPPPPPRVEPPKIPPPAYLGPAEEERPPAIVKEPVPLPEPPVPVEPVLTPLPEPKDEAVVFSRIVRATVGQLVEIPFRGSGWVYLGEMGSRRGIVYDFRRLDPEGQSFVFRIEAAGTYALKFYKQDFLHDFILNDYVQILAGEAPESAGSGWFNAPVDRGRVVAEPRWPSSLEEAERLSGQDSVPAAANAPAGNNQPPQAGAPAASANVPQATAPSSGANQPPQISAPAASANVPQAAAQPSNVAPPSGRAVSAAELAAATAAETTQTGQTPPLAANAPGAEAGLPPEAYLQKAKEEFDAGKAASAITLLDQFREQYPAGSDELYWLYGQFYEANSPNRDILTSLDYYRRLVREYPQSSRYSDAYRRIAYLERYYLYNN